MWMMIIGALFSLSFLLAAFVFVAIGKEANFFAVVGIVYLGSSLTLMWASAGWLRRRNARRKNWIFSLVGFSLFGLAFPLFYVTEAYDSHRDRQIVEAQRQTRVFDLADSRYVSESGNPIGIRLRYTVRFPRADAYAPSPRLHPIAENHRPFRGFYTLRAEVTPEPKPLRNSPMPLPYGRYESELDYRFTAWLIPFYLIPMDDRQGFCLSFAGREEEQAVLAEEDTPFRIHIGGTSLDEYLGGTNPETSGSYTLKSFYEAAQLESAGRRCSLVHSADRK